MQEHQQRVITEKEELDDKRTKLGLFLSGKIFKNLPVDEQARLMKQFDIMTQYSLILGERIANF